MCSASHDGEINPYLQGPINSNDEGDVIGGKTHGGQHDHHGDESSLRDTGCTDAGCGGSDAVGRDGGAECKYFYNMNNVKVKEESGRRYFFTATHNLIKYCAFYFKQLRLLFRLIDTQKASSSHNRGFHTDLDELLKGGHEWPGDRDADDAL